MPNGSTKEVSSRHTSSDTASHTESTSVREHNRIDNVMSFRPEVKVRGSSKWIVNGIRFATELEATQHTAHVHAVWPLAEETRVTPSAEPPNYSWDNTAKGLIPIPKE